MAYFTIVEISGRIKYCVTQNLNLKHNISIRNLNEYSIEVSCYSKNSSNDLYRGKI
jgi:hypothetical protein